SGLRTLLRPPTPSLLPYTTLFRSVRDELRKLEAAHRLRVSRVVDGVHGPRITLDGVSVINAASNDYLSLAGDHRLVRAAANALRSEEHTSELQSREKLVCRLLLEK